jgi:small-conductance mechanosensitive channel
MKEKIFGIIFSIFLTAVFSYLRIDVFVNLSFLLLLYFLLTLLLEYYKGENVEISGILNFLKLLFILIGILIVVFSLNLEKYGIAGATIVGLVLGLAAQHVLGNLFAGILITSTRIFKVGDKIGILSTNIPSFPLTFPPYKYFSYDYFIPYKGKIENIGVFFSEIITEDGLKMFIPNLVFLTGAVINISESKKEIGKLKVRIEVPLKKDVEKVIEKIKKNLSKYESEKFKVEEINMSEINWSNPNEPTCIIEIICKVRDFDLNKTKSFVLKVVAKTLKFL